ncbi:LOG family protein [Patescibacteria group bacterium]|nr:LOG family protein [Patescibacteria group bacterium]MBU0964530.1 LOG family protein [Patescibacteria group bacterium]
MESGNKAKIIYQKKKRRIIGELFNEAEIKNTSAWLTLHKSSKEKLITYESEGLVVSISGSGSLPADHNQCQQAAVLTEYVIKQGGIIMNGGRSSGIMESTSKIAKDKAAGIIFPELKKDASSFGEKIMVNSPQPRIELLATCSPIIVVFRGGLGTLMVLMRSIVHIRNRTYHPEQLQQMVFISNYWIGLLTTMMNLGTLPREFLTELKFFDQADNIIEKIPLFKK